MCHLHYWENSQIASGSRGRVNDKGVILLPDTIYFSSRQIIIIKKRSAWILLSIPLSLYFPNLHLFLRLTNQ